MNLTEDFFRYYENDEVKLISYDNLIVSFQSYANSISLHISYNEYEKKHRIIFSTTHSSQSSKELLKKLQCWREHPFIRVRNIFEPITIEIVNFCDMLTDLEIKVLNGIQNNMSYMEIGDKLGISKKGVDNTYQRIRKKMRNLQF